STDTLRMKKNHYVPDDPLLRPRSFDPAPPCRTAPLNLLKPGRLVFDDFQDTLTKFRHEFLRVGRPDPLDHAAAEVFLDTFTGRGRGAVEQVRLGLQAEFPVLNPMAFSGHPLAGTDGGKRAHNSD